MTPQPRSLPRWDLSPFFPGVESLELRGSFAELVQQTEALSALQERHGVRRRSDSDVDSAFAAAFDEVASAWETLQPLQRLLLAYVNCIVTTDARDEAAKARLSLIQMQAVEQDKLFARFVAWVGTSDLAALAERSPWARAHEFGLSKMRQQAMHQMTEPEEELATELRTSALTGWSRLHGNMSALLAVQVEMPDGPQTLPMSAVRGLASHPDRATRKAAYEAEVSAWSTLAVPFAAALNGIKGYQRAIRVRRGYPDDVAPSLLTSNITQAALDAMQQACIESFPDFHRYMRAKARALGIPALDWFDLTAPIGAQSRQYKWPEATALILENFGKYSARLADFARHAFAEQWLDAEPRVGKQGGAFCARITPGISRIMMNFDGSFGSVGTLAHELGHGYHNLCLKDRTEMQRGTPATLAETASIFCETLVFDAAAAQASPAERLALLDTVLERNLAVAVDIHSRFLLEQGVFERRATRDLTVPELNALMEEAQRQTYGPELASLHPYMWAVKGHYYGPLFYNYPYTFGLLFALGLYARYRQEPDSFRARYDDLLSSTGMADAVTLCRRFGFDIETPNFWRSSLDIVRGQIADFERAVI